MISTDRFPLPRDAWYIGAASCRLGSTPLAITIHGAPIALFRNREDGIPGAIEDRCPHRGVALSLGQVEDGALTCPYHGWRFDGAGACRHIPSLRVDQTIKNVAVRAYPVIERDGYVWIWTGVDAPVLGPAPIENFGAYAWAQGVIDMACEAILPIENNLDVCHAAFTHPHQHPQWFRAQAAGLSLSDYAIEISADGVIVTGQGTRLHYTLPDRVVVGAGDGFRLVLHHVPTVPGRCLQHWLFQRERVAAPTAPAWSNQEPEILAQDRRILESAQRTYLQAEGDFERSVEADAPGLAIRRLLAASDALPIAAQRRRRISVMS